MEISAIWTRELDYFGNTEAGISQKEDTGEATIVTDDREPNPWWPKNRIKVEGYVFSSSW